MLTTNIDIADRLINGQMGTVIKIGLNEKTQKPNIVYIKFDHSDAGKKCNYKTFKFISSSKQCSPY